MINARWWMFLVAWFGIITAHAGEVNLVDHKPASYLVGVVVLNIAYNFLVWPLVAMATHGYIAYSNEAKRIKEIEQLHGEALQFINDINASRRSLEKRFGV